MAYADRKALPRNVADLLWTVIRRMDTTERRWRIEELKQETGGG